MLEAYQPSQNGPFPVYLVINKYTVTSFDDLRTIISGDGTKTIPIPTKPRTTSDGETVKTVPLNNYVDCVLSYMID